MECPDSIASSILFTLQRELPVWASARTNRRLSSKERFLIGNILACELVSLVSVSAEPQGGNLLPEEPCTPSLEIQRPPTLPVHMDDTELGELFATCMPRLLSAARQILRNPEDSEDAMQEGLLLAFSNLGQFQGRSKFSTWLHSIVRNAARTHVRRTQSRIQCTALNEPLDGDELTMEELSVDPGLSPEEECSRRERARILAEVLQNMPATYKTVVQFCDVDGIDQKEAAQRLGLTVSAIKTTLFRARRVVARRIRGSILAPNDTFQSTEKSCFKPTSPGFSRTASSVFDCKRTVEEEPRMHARAREKRDLAGGNHEHQRKRPRFWKHSLPASGRVSVRSIRRSAS